MEAGPKRLVSALAAGLGCALLAIAFLLGRLSGRPAEAPIQQPGPTPRLEASAAPAPSPIVALANPETIPSPAPGAELPPPGSFGTLPPVRPEAGTLLPIPRGPETPPSPEKQAITTYFTQVDVLDNVGAGDPQDFARSLLTSVTSGDFSGFDELLGQAKRQQEGLRNITPPPPCQEYHRLALSLSGESVSMLETLRGALAKGDTTSLMAMAERAQSLEAQANELKAMADAIRRPAGS